MFQMTCNYAKFIAMCPGLSGLVILLQELIECIYSADVKNRY